MRFNPITTALIMWVFGFACGALCVWIRHQRAIAKLDAFVKPFVENILDPGYDYEAFDAHGSRMLARERNSL
jgi:hypothetical protein